MLDSSFCLPETMICLCDTGFLQQKMIQMGKFLRIKNITRELGVGTCSATYPYVKNPYILCMVLPIYTIVQCTFRSVLNKHEYTTGINALHAFIMDPQREGYITCDKW